MILGSRQSPLEYIYRKKMIHREAERDNKFLRTERKKGQSQTQPQILREILDCKGRCSLVCLGFPWTFHILEKQSGSKFNAENLFEFGSPYFCAGTEHP